MAKIIGLVVLNFCLTAAMWVFLSGGTTTLAEYGTSFYNTSQTNVSLWGQATNPELAENSGLWERIFGANFGIAAAAAVLGIAAGLFLWSRDINSWYMALAVLLAGWISFVWIKLRTVMENTSYPFGGASGGLISFFICGIMIVVQLLVLIDWGRNPS